MIKSLEGMGAMHKMLTAELPEKTTTYTPVSHLDVISLVRKKLAKAGFKITDENYKSSSNGDVGMVNFSIVKTSGRSMTATDIGLSACFINSYNKTAKFQFCLAGTVKACMNGMIVSTGLSDAIKRKHTGAAESIIEDYITEAISNAGKYWDYLLHVKTTMQAYEITRGQRCTILGNMILDDVIDSVQLTELRKELEKPSHIYDPNPDSIWNFYNHITFALKKTHPKSWIERHLKVYEIFKNVFPLWSTWSEVEDEESETVPVTELSEDDW